MIKKVKTSNTLRSRSSSKCEVDDFLTIQIDIVTLLELEIERKIKKKIEGRKRDRENEEKLQI